LLKTSNPHRQIIVIEMPDQMETVMKYIEVAIALPVFQTFTYSVPESFADFMATGKRVLVPFGQRRVTGYVFGQSQGSNTKEIKSILDILDEVPLFPSSSRFFRHRWCRFSNGFPTTINIQLARS
jgi:hypothetical protein